MTKTEAAKNHLMEHGTITTWEAITEHKNTRLSDTIFRLRRQGMNILSIEKDSIDTYGNKCRYVVYTLVKTA